MRAAALASSASSSGVSGALHVCPTPPVRPAPQQCQKISLLSPHRLYRRGRERAMVGVGVGAVMITRRGRQIGYRQLSSWVQRVILRVGVPADLAARRPVRSPADRGAWCARGLERSAVSREEATALHALSAALNALQQATGDVAKSAAYTGVVTAAQGLGDICSDFANPPLSRIWAATTRS